MVGVVWNLAVMRGWVVHMMLWAAYHVRIPAVVIVRCSIVTMWDVVMTVHNMIRISTVACIMMLPVRTWIVHLSRMIWISLGLADCWSVLDPMTTI